MSGLPRGTTCLVLILAGAFLFRAAAAVVIQRRLDQPPQRLCLFGDADGYWKLGLKIAEGQAYSVYDPPRYVLRMPGFPALLALGMKVFGDQNYLAVRLLLAGLGTLACGLVYGLGKMLFGAETGLIAAALAAVSPTMIVFSVLFISETLFAVTLLGSLILLVKLVRTDAIPTATLRDAAIALCAGVMIGGACLVRPTWLLVAPGFVLVYLLFEKFKGAAWLRCALLLAGVALTLLPWTLRNHAVTGHYIPTTLWVGPSLYDGLHPQATGASDMRFVETDRIYERESEYAADQYYRRKSWEFVQSHPGRTLQLAAIKLWRFWSPWPNSEQFGDWAVSLGVAALFIPVFALACLGAWLTRSDFWGWFLPAAPILYFGAVHAVFIGSLRYRLPAEYALLVLSAVGIQWVFQYRRRGTSSGDPSMATSPLA